MIYHIGIKELCFALQNAGKNIIKRDGQNFDYQLNNLIFKVGKTIADELLEASRISGTGNYLK